MDEKLSLFGSEFISSVRDNTLFVLEGIISGHMKSDLKMQERINELSDENIDLLRDFAYSMVDLSLHNMLLMFQEDRKWKLSNPDLDISDLNKISDGLPGELYTSDGWISRFSEYATTENL
jgi:hypothetical protein